MLDGLDTAVGEADTLVILPAMAGGGAVCSAQARAQRGWSAPAAS